MTGELQTLQAIIDANDQAVFALDRDLRYTAFNRTHAAVMRALYGAEITLGGRLTEYQTVDADRDVAAANLAKALAGERVIASSLSGEEGRQRSFDVVYAPQTDSAGAVVGVVVRACDVTERRQAEDELSESEARYALLFENMHEGFAYCRLLYDEGHRPHDLVYVAVNPAFTRLTGLKDVTGKRVTEVIPTMMDETPELFDTYVSVVETGEPAEFDIDFTPLGLWLHISVLRPEPDHFVAVFTDITENKRAEQAVRDSEARFRGYFEQSLVGAAVTSPAKGWVDVNQATCDLLGYSREELSALSWAELTHPDDLAADVAQFERVIAGEIDEYLLEKRFVRKDGGVVYVDLGVRCQRTQDGSVDYMLAILSDITERKRTDQVRAFLARTSSGTVKEPFFEALARYLAESLDMDFVCIDRLDGDGFTAHTVAVWCDGQFEDNVSYALKDTPCGDVVGNTVCCFPASVRQHFPRDQVLEDLRAESYVGVTLFDHSSRPIGLIAVISRRPLMNRRAAEAVLELVAVRAAAELEVLDAEAELREMHERLDLAQRASGAGIWDWDVASGAIDWSPEMFELFGLDAETVAAGFDSWGQALHPDDAEVSNARIATALADHAPLDSEYRIVKSDGEIRWINALGQGVYDDEGVPVRMTGMCIDISERKRAEDEIQRLNADLERRVSARTRDLTAANTELEEFVYSISHDLRSPLRALSGFSELVQMDYGELIDDAGRDYLRRIRNAAQHLGDLMDALLSLSKVSRYDLSVHVVDLSALARGVAAQLREADPGRDAEFEIEDDLIADSDPALCEIVLQNLLENAWKFSAGASPARISLSVECVDDRRTYCVRDNGVGFDPRYRDKLFIPFERLHTAEEFPGTGIGLATVRRAVTRLGGQCWAEGEPGDGARVYFGLGEPC